MDKLEFGIDYIIPKPLDLRLIEFESAAVAQAAMDTGVAQITLDIEEYKKELRERLAASRVRVSDFIESYDLGI